MAWLQTVDLTPKLIKAATSGDEKELREILDAGGNPNETTHVGRSALMAAAECGKTGAVKLLISAGADVNYFNDDRKFICKQLFPSYKSAFSVWLEAIKDGNFFATLRDSLWFLRKPAGQTALMQVGIKGDFFETAKELISAGAIVDTQDCQGYTALSCACSSNAARTVELLLNAGANPNLYSQNRCTPLMEACRSPWRLNHYQKGDERKPEIVKLLISKGAKIDVQEACEGMSPLHFAAKYGYPDVVKLLLTVGADRTVKTNVGKTALNLAKDGATVTLLSS